MKKSIFSHLISISIKLISCLLVAIILSIIIEWIGMAFIWKDNPYHAKEMFEYEYTFIGSSFKQLLFGQTFTTWMNQVLTSINSLFYKIMATNNHAVTTSSEMSFSTRFLSYFEAAGYMILIVLMRAYVFILSLPWFIICAIVAFTDGLVERSIRKFEGGVEHGMIHHLARSNFSLIIATAFIIYLGIPIAIHPATVIVPFGILSGLIIYVAAWSFKKYL